MKTRLWSDDITSITHADDPMLEIMRPILTARRKANRMNSSRPRIRFEGNLI